MKTKKRFLSILISLVMVLGLMPGMSLTAYADDPYASIINTTTVIKFDNKEWYLIDYDTDTVTLLAKECVGSSQYNASTSFVAYESNPTVKTAVVNWYNYNITADAKTAVSGNAMFLLTTAQAIDITNADVRKDATVANGGWWLCSQGDTAGTYAAYVNGESGDVNAYGNDVGKTLGVRPALKLNLSKVVFDSATNTFSLATPYPLWVGGTQVTSANAGNIFGNNTASYDDVSKTLTLNGYSYNGEYNGVSYDGNESLTIVLNGYYYNGGKNGINSRGALNIVLTGSNTIISKEKYSGIWVVEGSLILSGSGSLSIECSNISSCIVNANEDITIESGTVIAQGRDGLASPHGDVIIKGGNVTLTGAVNGIIGNNVTISGGTVTATGGSGAISGSVKNFMAGTGWTDTAGTQDKKAIPISDEGQNLTAYKKVQFPEVPNPPATVTKAPTAKTLTYTGSEQELVTAGAAEGGDMQYAIGTDDKTAPTSGWSTSIPSKTDAGTYYVWYKAVGDDSHTDSEAAYVTSKIRAKISATVTFKVAKGSWDDGTTADKSVTLNGLEGDTLKLSADQIPAVGSKPDAEYQAGSWDTVPSIDAAITGNKTFTYTYSPKGTISRTVTFYVVNGSWDDGTAESKSVTLTGKEGDTLKLSADQIPAVGSKPNANYKEGSWNTVPDTTNAITADTAYTYTYEKMDPAGKDGKDGPIIITDLKLGSQGTEVQALQQRLAALGYYPGDIDGDFGRVTDAAVREFQWDNGLYVDGVVGAVTRQALGLKASSSSQGTNTDPSSDMTLALGSVGEAVAALQQKLASLGYNAGDIDGYFGPVTDAAVKAFQRDNGLYADGVVGSFTRQALGYEAPAPAQEQRTTTSSDMTLALGSAGEAVLALQQTLASLGYNVGDIDGYFGYVTEAAVMEFQWDNGLYVDGVVGPYTWAALRGGSAYIAPAEEAVAPQIAPNNGDLVYGMTSDEIAYIQLILNLLGYDVGVIDGYFGDVTLEAVKAFQRDFGLYVDGIIGAQTKAALGIQ